ncbi:MAG: orotidine-5'-phosphate decarboxylase [Phycisphaerales bacterium]|nr:orotidine-5'-phosphate decarboxylase [Phycisphaerae bacterium]NNF42284.1 orotidine-5'-phosphate decarboxylase [Phycisphaerales bacterium]NNM25875.1 orotidine-5'-phosphate decarboxylase [Phycisphaerales bacterium]
MTESTVTTHAADRLVAAIERCGAPVCVGLDPVAAKLPAAVRSGGDELVSIRAFTLGLLDAVAKHVPCVKIQSACFERYHAPGVALIGELVAAARERGLIVILDAKRGDIGISAEHYAAAVFDDESAADWVTLSPYLGEESLVPFLRAGGGAFSLVRTSNPDGDRIQSQRLEDGRTVAECVADLVAGVGRAWVGTCGYSQLGAVVGATKVEDLEALRERMPQQILLLPGVGAQGACPDDLRSAFHPGGRGAIVTSSRAIIFASSGADWATRAAEAAARLADEIGTIAGCR